MSPSILKSFAATALIATWSVSSVQAKPASSLVAFRAAQANAGRHITAAPKGGLILGSTVLSNKEVFTLIDLNGAPLKNGDKVQVTYDSGKRPSYWREAKGKITRTGDRPDAACTFQVTWKVPNVSLMLRAASGNYVSGPGKGKPVAVVSKATDRTAVFTLIKNPKPVKVVKTTKVVRKAPAKR